MLDFLRDAGKASERRLRLFACVCYRRFHEHFVEDVDGDGLFVVELAEAFADGLVDPADLAGARDAIVPQLWDQCSSAVVRQRLADYATAVPLGDVTPVGDAFVEWVESNLGEEEVEREVRKEHAAASDALRDLIGNPFRHVRIDPAVLSRNNGAARRVARAIYADQAFERLAVLADALEDAGCADPELLGHLRGPGPHVRGCWVVDLILGKK
jgi:hypothetical protein